jgi:hypothetical protein
MASSVHTSPNLYSFCAFVFPVSSFLTVTLFLHVRMSVANVVPSSPILVIIMMEALRSSETSVPTRATRRNISKDGQWNMIA